MLISLRPPISKFLTIDDLKKFDTNLTFASKTDKRKKVRVCVIEDEIFFALNQLRDSGFDITLFRSLTKLEDLLPFPIIVCDLKGVNADSKLQGAGLVRRIRDEFPDKFLVAFTGAPSTTRLFIEAERAADAIMSKRTTDVDQLVEKLDHFCDLALRPSELWQRVRAKLISKCIPAIQLLYLEHYFVLSIQKGNKQLFLGGAQGSSPNSDLRSVVISIVSNGIYEVIKKATLGIL
jgi:hypothetical protein